MVVLNSSSSVSAHIESKLFLLLLKKLLITEAGLRHHLQELQYSTLVHSDDNINDIALLTNQMGYNIIIIVILLQLPGKKVIDIAWGQGFMEVN